MNKKQILILSLLAASVSSYAGFNEKQYEEAPFGIFWGDTHAPKYRLAAGYEFETNQKLARSYEQFFRILDEENRNKGISKRYIQDFYGKIPRYSDDADVIPVWIERNRTSDTTVKSTNPDYKRKETLEKLVAQKDYKSFSKVGEKGKEYRISFGNNNKIKNLKFKNEKDMIADKNTVHEVDGKYELYGIYTSSKGLIEKDIENGKALFNVLELSEKEYREKFLDNNGNLKPKSELANYIADKMNARYAEDQKMLEKKLKELEAKEKDPNKTLTPQEKSDLKDIKRLNARKVIVKDGELYSNGKRVLWNNYPVSRSMKLLRGPRYYQNTVITKILAFENFQDDEKMLYQKDGDLYITDVLTEAEGDKPKVKYNEKDLATAEMETLTTAMLNDYFSMEEKDFKKKWDFDETNVADYEKLSAIKTKKDEIEGIEKELKTLQEKLGGEGGWDNHTLYYRYFEAYSWTVSDEQKAQIFAGTDEQAQKYMKEHNLNLQQFQKLLTDVKTLKTNKKQADDDYFTMEIGLDIKRMSTDKATIVLPGVKVVELGGQGRIDGEIDLGNGYNTLTINENNSKYTGSFGTNITLGPEAKLKNINVIAVGRQDNVEKGISGLSGITSLFVEVDPNKVDKDGHLYQHALKDTWKDENKIVFRKAGPWMPERKYRNDFVVALKTTQIAKDGQIIDMGRPLEYQDDLDRFNYKLNLMADTPVQELTVLEKKPGQENDLVQVNYKKEVEQFTAAENEIYRSLVNAEQMPALADTFSITNKTKNFSDLNKDKMEIEKNMRLALAMSDVNKTSEDILNELADHKIHPQKSPEILKMIDIIKKNDRGIEYANQLNTDEKNELESNKGPWEELKKHRSGTKALEKYKRIDTSEAKTVLTRLVQEFAEVPENPNEIGVPKDIMDKINKKRFDGEGVSVPTTAKEAIKSGYLKESEVKDVNEKYVETFFRNRYGSDEKIKERLDELIAIADKELKVFSEKLEAAKPDKSKGEEELETGLWQYPRKQLLDNLEELKTTKSWKDDIENLVRFISYARTSLKNLEKFEDLSQEKLDKKLLSNLESNGLFNQIRLGLYLSRRELDAIDEAKIIFTQLHDNNIYSRLNKITKNEMDVYAPIVFDNSFDFTSKKDQARGGAVSARYATDRFKGTVYNAYGTYEKSVNDNTSAGVVVGGSNADFHEIVNDDLRNVTTNSKIKGTSAYVGAFGRHQVRPNIEVIGGLGVQYGDYKVDREMKNHYQQDMFKGKVKNLSGNLYTGAVYTYKINDTLDAHVKGMLSYTMVNQGKAKEDGKPASIEVKAQNFNYLDGQVGLGVTKTSYGDNLKYTLSGTAYTVYGIVGYDNDDLKGKFAGSSSEFGIKGQQYDKQSVKLVLDYNVEHDAGYNYGLTGSYNKNNKEDNISVGVKAGYKF